MSDDVRVRLGGPDDIDDCLRVLTTAYDREFTREWFDWKHRDGPWGPSRIYIAEDDEGALGVAFGMDWPMRRRRADGSRVDVDGVRLVDGGTVPAARGRGVLGRLIRGELAVWEGARRVGIVYVTATPAAQKSHARNAATTLEPIRSTVGPPRSLRPAAIIRDLAVLGSYDADAFLCERLTTAWSPAALRWRIDQQSGHEYEVASLAAADEPNGIVYRIGRQRGLRSLIPILTWGSPREQRILVGAAAWSTRSPLVQAPVGAAAPARLHWPVRSSGESVVCLWEFGRNDTDDLPSATMASSWSLGMADLEGLI